MTEIYLIDVFYFSICPFPANAMVGYLKPWWTKTSKPIEALQSKSCKILIATNTLKAIISVILNVCLQGLIAPLIVLMQTQTAHCGGWSPPCKDDCRIGTHTSRSQNLHSSKAKKRLALPTRYCKNRRLHCQGLGNVLTVSI